MRRACRGAHLSRPCSRRRGRCWRRRSSAPAAHLGAGARRAAADCSRACSASFRSRCRRTCSRSTRPCCATPASSGAAAASSSSASPPHRCRRRPSSPARWGGRCAAARASIARSTRCSVVATSGRPKRRWCCRTAGCACSSPSSSPSSARKPDDEVLRFKLKRLVPFRVDELRLRAGVVPVVSRPGGLAAALHFRGRTVVARARDHVRVARACASARSPAARCTWCRCCASVSGGRCWWSISKATATRSATSPTRCPTCSATAPPASTSPTPDRRHRWPRTCASCSASSASTCRSTRIEEALVCGRAASRRAVGRSAARSLRAAEPPARGARPAGRRAGAARSSWHQAAPLVAAATREVA